MRCAKSPWTKIKAVGEEDQVMETRDHRYLVPFVLIALIIVVAACNADQSVTEAPASEDQIATAVAQTLAAVPSATAPQVADAPTHTPEPADASTHTPEPEPSSTTTHTPEPQPTDAPCTPPAGWAIYTVRPGENLFRIAQRYGMSAEELQRANCLPAADRIRAGQLLHVPYLIPTLQPTDVPEPTEEPEAAIDIKEELFFGGGAGGSCDAFCLGPPPTTQLPAITWNEGREYECGQLCLYGFPFDEEIVVELFAPSGELAGSGVFQVKPKSDEDRFNVVHISRGRQGTSAHASMLDGVTQIGIRIWLPVGVPIGQWHAAANSASGDQAEGPVEIQGFSDPRISTMPDTYINPFEDYVRGAYLPGERVRVRGINFEPHTRLPVGTYYLTGIVPTQVAGLPGFEMAILRDSQLVNTDSHGDFSTTFDVGSSEPGSYCTVAVTDPDETIYSFTGPNPQVSCYIIPQLRRLITYVDGKPGPDLITSWEVSEDGLIWTFELESELLADYRLFTADVLQEMLEDNRQALSAYQACAPIDDHIIQVTLKNSDAGGRFLEELSLIEILTYPH
jgi:LysM repeat protein